MLRGKRKQYVTNIRKKTKHFFMVTRNDGIVLLLSFFVVALSVLNINNLIDRYSSLLLSVVCDFGEMGWGEISSLLLLSLFLNLLSLACLTQHVQSICHLSLYLFCFPGMVLILIASLFLSCTYTPIS